jgi:TonB-dependent SusC/RagA subfamily outer membrane receptor
MILQSLSDNHRIVKYFSKRLESVPVGNYRLFLVMNDLSVVIVDSINILHYSTFCRQINQLNFQTKIGWVESLTDENKYAPVVYDWKDNYTKLKDNNYAETYPAGSGYIKGIIVDAKGHLPISLAYINIKGTKWGINSLTDGSFIIKNIHSGNYTIIVSGIGYESKEIKVNVPNNGTADVKVLLTITNQSLNDVVVVGYGLTRRREVTGSVSSLSISSATSLFTNTEQSLQGRVAGVSVNNGVPGNDAKIFIRGLSSYNNSNMPVYVIDGIIYNEIPKNLAPDMIESMEVSKDESILAKYGAAAANGVVIITTKIKSARALFRDYAFWQPELISDKDGKIKFSVTYPDNITSWQTYVLAMDKKLRVGKVSATVQAYKPVMAQLSVPQFLVEGDSVVLIGKSLNYTNDPYSITTRWVINSVEKKQEPNQLRSHASLISAVSYTTTGTDSVKASFSLKTATGFKDGEERKIPVYRKGVEENTGEFRLLNKDTTVGFSANNQQASLELSADNKTLDVLLKEIEHLKQYPFYCMEQTASRLRGLLMEKTIRRELNQPFKEEKMITQLLNKLQRVQLFDGGWAWWENGKANFYITNYIINALLPLRADPLVEVTIRNGLLYLQNELDRINDNSLLAALNTMAAAGHSMDYVPYLKRLNFDSLSLHQQWQWIYIQQKVKGNYQLQLKQLVDRHRATMLGGIYWGNENYLWYSNAVATTVLAYEVLKNEKTYSNLLPHMMQYFLEMRQNGYWRNTVESAGILSVLLPDVLTANKEFIQPGSLKISGDTSFTVTGFPFTVSMSSAIKNITVQKSGGGLTYLSVYQKWFNRTPDVVNDKFEIRSYFKKNDEVQQYLTSGEKVKMVVEVNVKKDAEFVMLQIPIPAGCTYASKNQDQWNMHKEFFKDRVVMFAEELAIGKYAYEIELEPRYNGKYILNPSKTELMYFPVFYGRNEMKTVEIK